MNNGLPDRGLVVSLIAGTEITASFGEDGQLTDNAGCNDYYASYQVDDNHVTLGPATLTRKFCDQPEGIMTQEAEYQGSLTNSGDVQNRGQQHEYVHCR